MIKGSALDFTGAVAYRTGIFPPKTEALDARTLIAPLGEAAAALARYDGKMASTVNSRLLLAPLAKQDAVASSRMEGTISTIEGICRVEAEQCAGSPGPDDRSIGCGRGSGRPWACAPPPDR